MELVRIFEKTNPGLPMRVDHAPLMLGDEKMGYNYILITCNDTWQSENLQRRIVGVHAHVDVVLTTHRHDSLKEILHIFTQPVAVYAVVPDTRSTDACSLSVRWRESWLRLTAI